MQGTERTADHGPALPPVGERVALALSLRLPATSNLDRTAAENIDSQYPGVVTEETIRDLREGRDESVTGIQRETIAAWIGLSTEVLFGSDPDKVIPQINDLRTLAESRGLEHLIQLRAGDTLSARVRRRLAEFLEERTPPKDHDGNR